MHWTSVGLRKWSLPELPELSALSAQFWGLPSLACRGCQRASLCRQGSSCVFVPPLALGVTWVRLERLALQSCVTSCSLIWRAQIRRFTPDCSDLWMETLSRLFGDPRKGGVLQLFSDSFRVSGLKGPRDSLKGARFPMCFYNLMAKCSGESNRPLTPILLKSIAIHLPFQSRYFLAWEKSHLAGRRKSGLTN